MTSRERLLKVLNREETDCVPVCPDISNMIPAKRTGKPFWDIYLYQDPPLYEAYIESAKFFGFDSLMDTLPVTFPDDVDTKWEEYLVFKSDERIITQAMDKERSTAKNPVWRDKVTVYFRENPPCRGIAPEKAGLAPTPKEYWRVEGRKELPEAAEILAYAKRAMGDQGIVGAYCGTSCLIHNEQEVYDYFDDPDKYRAKRDELIEYYTKRFYKLIALPEPPDFIATGSSGSLVFQTPEIFRELALPIVKTITALCKEHGIPSHIHSCGPETELIKICAQETGLTVIDPLEIPPMGDSNLAQLKKLYGDKLVLKGNLHTTNIMLNGTVKEVVEASKRAIDDAAEGGGFILSTGDQCGMNTPYENLYAMIETARTYGAY